MTLFSFLSGTVAEKIPQSPHGAFLVVDVHGMGFQVQTSERCILQCPERQQPVLVHTHLVVREDAMVLVGFLSREERDLFQILQSASGVGVKVALALLSAMPVSEIVQAVISGNHKPLTAAKGIGPKLAQKIILELKEKMMAWRDIADLSPTDADDALPVSSAVFLDIEAVLLSLGYTQHEINQSVRAVLQQENAEPDSSEWLLREALRWLSRQA
jgi:Holliday junction DNA helicase RuvA